MTSGDAGLVRPRLHNALDVGLDQTLSLVVAPAGYGKSTLLSRWAETVPMPVAWVGFTGLDNDPGHFMRAVAGALDGALDDDYEEFLERVTFATPASAPKLAEQLGRSLADAGRFVLVLDDVHRLTEASTVETMQRLVEALPSNVCAVIAARHDPSLALGRMRLQGRLTEIREAHLAFTVDETRSLLAASGIELSDESLRDLHDRTGGWGAAIRLALISMAQSGDPETVVRRLVGTDRAISEYLLEEVISDMPPAKQQFLMRTSILDEVNPAIAEALTGRVDCRLVLEELAAAGEFTSHTQVVGWYRYHQLLRDLLRARIHELDPIAVPELHRRAAEWCLRNDEPVRAIRHAIAAGDVEDASEWLAQSATELVASGRAVSVVELSGRLLDHTADPTPLLLMTRLWALYNVFDQPLEIDRLLDTLEDVLCAASPDVDRRAMVHGGDPRSFADPSALPWVRAIKARTHGDVGTLLELNSPENVPSPSGRVEMWLAEGSIWSERYEEAESLLEAYHERAQREQYAPSMVHDLGLHAYAAVGQARFDEAHALLAEAWSLIDRFGLAHLFHTSYAHLAAGWLHWERGELAEAESSLVASQEHVEQWKDIPVAVQHAELRSRTRWSLGDRVAPAELLDQTERLIIGRPAANHFPDRIGLARARLDLLDGEPSRAARRLPGRRSRLDGGAGTPFERIVLARIGIAAGEAVPDSSFLVPTPLTSPLQGIELSMLQAARALAHGEADRATEALAEAMTEARRVGAVQRVIDERQLFTAVYADAADRADFRATADHAAGDSDRAGVPAPGREVLIEPLSERERDVLDLLDTHLTYPEIADELFVSYNTARSHAKAIHRKLAVSSRAEAVNRARDLGLLDSGASAS